MKNTQLKVKVEEENQNHLLQVIDWRNAKFQELT